MRFFLCITSYTRGYGFDHWVFELSFFSFFSPYHPGLCYVLCLKTTLRPQDQMLSLIVFRMGLCRLVEVQLLLCFLLWEILLEAFGFSLQLGMSKFDGFLSWRQSIDDVGFILLLGIRYPHWGIFPLCFEILSRRWVVWLSLTLIIEMLD